MHNQPQLTLDRLERVMRERVTPAVHTTLAQVDVTAWRIDGDGEPVPAAHALGLTVPEGRETPVYEPLTVGETWGPAWGTTWLRITGTVPEGVADVLELVLDLGWEDHSVGGQCEGLVHRADGTVVKGLHPRGGWVRLSGPGAPADLLADDGSFELYVEAAANPLVLGLPPFVVTELGEKPPPGHPEPYRLVRADISAFQGEVWEFARDLEVLGGLARQVPDTETRYWRIVRALDKALDAYDGRRPDETVAAARAHLAGVLAQPAHASAHRLSAVGHAHIDSAWLWPLRETSRKVARTVANVLALMDADPRVTYAMSSAQQFAWLQEQHPDLFERVRHYVAEGRFIPVGGMWVESDAVMPSGESLVRQFTRGKRYFRETFGLEPEEVWLPDSFGYSGSLPQLARRAGYRWFLTQKLSWNDTNVFPHHTFHWEGIDGTRILTHFPPVDTYAADVRADELQHAAATFRDKAVSSHSLLLFGYGDGGGGPTREMGGRLERFADLEGAPAVEQRSPHKFFEDVEAELDAAPDAPSWLGELYLELHRGTLTSQSAMKRGNRRAEALLRSVEYLAAQAALRGVAPYPAEELDDLWATVLLHQFHDILPGSSISWVHREARETYRVLEERLRGLAAGSARALARDAGRPGRVAAGGDGTLAVRPAAAAPAATPVTVTPQPDGATVLDNGLVRVVVDADGLVPSMTDLVADRQLVVEGERLGKLVLFRDEPVRWDAWDLDRHVLRHASDVTGPARATVSSGEAGARVDVERAFGSSTARVSYVLRPGAAQLDVEAEIDWHEREHLLKVSLPLAVSAASARFETQYGSVERTLHANTSWDEAHFESCTHRWVHVAEPGYGVGVVNDSTYGADLSRPFGARSGVDVRLSLLRGPRFPDPDTDLGVHTFAWSVVCSPEITTTVDAAALLNAPLLDALPELPAPLSLALTRGRAVLDWLKLADDGSGDVVVRLHEVAGGHAAGHLVPGDELDGWLVRETDLLERPTTAAPDLPLALVEAGGDALPAAGDAVPAPADAVPAAGAGFTLRPFQLATLRLCPPAPASSRTGVSKE